MNWFASFAVLLTITQALVPATGKAPNSPAHNHQKQHNYADSSDKPRLPPIPETKKTGDSPALKTDPGEGSANEEHSPINITNPTPMPVPWRWYEKVAWGFNLGLVVVGVVGIIVAVGTLKTIKKQTDIQSAAMKQWVELVDWKSQVLLDGRFEIGFSLLNPTNFLIVLICAEVRFKPELPEMYSLVRTGNPLPPKTPITFKLHPPISGPRLQTFASGQQMGIVIEGLIVFRSALEEVVTQEFSGPILCSLSGTSLESTMTLRTTKDTKGKRNKEG